MSGGRPPARRPIEETLGDAVVHSIDDFVFRDIEDETTARSVFDFIEDPAAREILATVLRGVRWQQKIGLIVARQPSHPAHAAHVRSQLVEYGALTELALRQAVTQTGPPNPPATLQGLIERAAKLGLLDDHGTEAATRLREARNRVHLSSAERPPRFQREGRKALRDFTTVVNQLRRFHSLPPWQPTRPPLAQ